MATPGSRDFRTLPDFKSKLSCCRSCQPSTKERMKSNCESNKVGEGVSSVNQSSFVQNVTNVPVVA